MATKPTKLTEKEIIVLAGVFARANMGQALPERDHVGRVLGDGYRLSLSGSVLTFCEDYIESDEIYDMFMEEAKMWVKILKKEYKTRERLAEVHKDIAALAW